MVDGEAMAHDPKDNALGWTTEIVDDKEIRVLRVPPGANLRVQMPDGSTGEITAPPEGLAFIRKKDFDEIEAVNQALKGKSS
jgi:hypothetical protein